MGEAQMIADQASTAAAGDGTRLMRWSAGFFALSLGGAALFFWAAHGPQVFIDAASRLWASCF